MEFRIDTTGYRFVVAEEPEQRRDFDTGQFKTDKKTGAPLFQVRVLVMGPDGSAPVRVGVVGDPGVRQSQFVRPTRLVLNVMERRGEAIQWWTADGLVPDPDMPVPAPPAPASGSVAGGSGESGKGSK